MIYKQSIVVAVCVLLLLSSSAFAQGQISATPSFALGHPPGTLATAPKSTAPNLVEGSEFNRPQAVTYDNSTGALYVADTSNNRVLGWRDASSFLNGAKADLVVGQRDLFSTGIGGPGATLQQGLNQPTNVVVDGSGNLFVADAGNNRILRFSRPFDQQGDLKFTDLVIGQDTMLTRGRNSSGLSASSLAATDNRGAAFRIGMAFDAQGNLWVSDSANHRVLRYPAGVLGVGATDGPSANLVLGQPNFTTNTAVARNAGSRREKRGLRFPSGLAFDSAGRLFVSDELLRVVVYEPGLTSSKPASRIMGIAVVVAGQPVPPVINERSLGVVMGGTWVPPEGVFTIGDIPFVVDTPANRILRFPPFDQWAPETEDAPSPAAVAVIGQDSLRSDDLIVHRDRAEPAADTLWQPSYASVGAGNMVYVADSTNHRVLQFPDLSTGPVSAVGPPYAAERVLGQPGFENRSVNRIEGREFFFGSSTFTGADVVIDWNSDPPHLYVADPANNRVLGFRDARRVRNGTFADVVRGQPGMFRSLTNYPANKPTTRNETGMFLPAGAAVDASGNLYVADFGNARVLRFPDPFAQPAGLQPADLVLGQPSFTSRVTDATERTMAGPTALHFTIEGTLLVSDSIHHRVLQFVPPFTNGMAASRVIGQPDFATSTSGNGLNRMNSPRGISTDGSDRLYVADAGNNRVLVFGDIRGAPLDPLAAFALTGQRAPFDVLVDRTTGKAWVADTNNNRVLLYPQFDKLLFVDRSPEFSFQAVGPLALAGDPVGNLYIADRLNRVVGHFQQIVAARNAANGLNGLTAGMWTSLWFPLAPGIETTAYSGPLPFPTELSDVQVMVDETPMPILFVGEAFGFSTLNFLMPNGAPASGFVEIVVVRPSTGQILAAGRIQVDVAAPGLFTLNQSGSGQIAALNQDNTINSSGNPEQAGRVVQMFATGAGAIAGAPPDGEAASGLTPTPTNPQVIVNGRDAQIQYSGLAPFLVGVWQINFVIPAETPAGDMWVVVLMRDRASWNAAILGPISTTIAVKR